MSESENFLYALLPLLDVSAPGIFRLSGNTDRQQKLVEALRNGQDAKILEWNAHDVATVVKKVLREYPGRLFDSTTESVLSRLVKNDGDATINRMHEILMQLSPDRISMLALILPFLNKVSLLSDVNKMDAINLARVVAIDFFPEISNPLNSDSTLVRQIIDWRIKVVEKLITYGDRIIEQHHVPPLPSTPISHIGSTSSITPVFGKTESTASCLTGDASQKRKRPPQSPLKSVWHGLTNIFSKTPRPGRPESTPPNGTPSFFNKLSNRFIASGKKVKHEDEEQTEIMSGYRSDDNALRCPPVKQNLRAKFSHKKKSPKVTTTPGRLKTPSTPLYASNYGTFTKNPFPAVETQVRTELFHFTSDQTEPTGSATNQADEHFANGTFVFSSQQNLTQTTQPSTSSAPPPASGFMFDHLQPDKNVNVTKSEDTVRNFSPVRISPEPNLEAEGDGEWENDENAPNPLVDNNFTGDSNSYSNGNSNNGDDFGSMPVDDAMETEAAESYTRPNTAASSNSQTQPVHIPGPSPSMSEEMRDSLCDLINLGVTPRCRQPVMDGKMSEQTYEPVVETTFDGNNDAERRLIAQVRRQLGPTAATAACPSAGTRRPSVANLERSAMVSQGRRLWEQGGPCTSTMSNYPSSFSLALQHTGVMEGQQNIPAQSIQSNSYPRMHITQQSSKRQTDL